MNGNRSMVVDNTELNNVGCSHGVNVTKDAYVPSPVSGDRHCVF